MTAKHVIKLIIASFVGIISSRELRSADVLVWSDWYTQEILVGSTTGGPATRLFHATDFVAPSDASPTGVASDGHYVYWGNLSTGQVFRGTFDGVASELFGNANTPPPVFPGEPRFVEGLAVDDNAIYWYEQVRDHIVKGPLDGSSAAINLYPDGLQGPYFGHGVATDSNYVYWTDASADRILRAKKDGSGPVTELFGPTDYPYPASHGEVGIAVFDDFVYWTDASTSRIMRGAKDGSGTAQQLYDLNQGTPVGIAAAGNFVYWIDSKAKAILRGSITGGGGIEILFDQSKYPGNPREILPQWLAIVPDVVPEPSSINLALFLLYGAAVPRRAPQKKF